MRTWTTISAIVAVAASPLIGAAPASAHDIETCTEEVHTRWGAQVVCHLIPHSHGEPGDSRTETDERREYTIDDVSFVAEFVGGINPLDEYGRGRTIGSIPCPGELTPGGGDVVRSVTRGADLTLEQVLALGLDPTSIFTRYNIVCYDSNTVDNRIVIVRTVDGPGFDVVFDGALARAVAQARPPAIATSPTGRGVVNFPTWFWVENWAPVVGTDAAGLIDIAVTGTPQATAFATGEDDGATGFVCTGPGQAWDPGAGIDPMTSSDCSHTYGYPSAWDGSGVFEVTATTDWSFSWTLNGVDQGVITTLPRTNQLDLNVVEIQTVATPNPDG